MFHFSRIKQIVCRTLLDVTIDLIKANNIMADFEANVVSKSSGYIGPQIEVGLSHLNTFHGAERLEGWTNRWV